MGYVCLFSLTTRKAPRLMTSSPMNAMSVSLGFTIILSCIVIGSTTAYGVFVTLVNSGLLSSYMICIGCTQSSAYISPRFHAADTRDRHSPKASPQRIFSPLPLQPRQNWRQRREYACFVFPSCGMDFPVLPECPKSDEYQHELGGPNIRGGRGGVHSVLHHDCEA